MEAVGRALANHLQRTAAAECWPQAATVQLSFAAPHFTVEAEPADAATSAKGRRLCLAVHAWMWHLPPWRHRRGHLREGLRRECACMLCGDFVSGSTPRAKGACMWCGAGESGRLLSVVSLSLCQQ